MIAVDIVEGPLRAAVTAWQATGGQVTGVVANVMHEDDVARMIVAAYATQRRLDILCNNVGIMDLMTPAADVSRELWGRVLGVNLTGHFLACRTALPRMVAQGGGSIVNTSSEAGLRRAAAGTAYTVSKHGVIGLTQSIAFFYGEQGIRCNAVCPGGVLTALGVGGAAPHPGGMGQVGAVLQATTHGHVAQPEQIAALIAFLPSDEASNVNGAILPADHGWSAV